MAGDGKLRAYERGGGEVLNVINGSQVSLIITIIIASFWTCDQVVFTKQT